MCPMGGGSGRVVRSCVPTVPTVPTIPTADLSLSLQVRRAYRRYFRSGASACLANFIYRRLVSGDRGDVAPSHP